VREVRRLEPGALLGAELEVERGQGILEVVGLGDPEGRSGDAGRSRSQASATCAGGRPSSRPAPGQLTRIAELAAATDQVTECHRITGEDCFLIKLHASTIARLEEVLDLFLVHGQTVSSIVVASPVPGQPLPIPD
jgi:DNA-binding Lrp family transcriptional regulator